MNDETFWSLKLLKVKYGRVDQIIYPFCRIGSHQEIKSPLFNLWEFEKLMMRPRCTFFEAYVIVDVRLRVARSACSSPFASSDVNL